MAEPKDFQVRIYYRLDGERYLDDFWTTKTIADLLIAFDRESKEFEQALIKLNPQLRVRQGYAAKDWKHKIKPEHILGKPELSGMKEISHPNQERFYDRRVEKKVRYLKPPLELPQKQKTKSDQLPLFKDF
jgi:N-acetylmuramoyl-L-alanine amidase CwlA